jgi:hypothetical protein
MGIRPAATLLIPPTGMSSYMLKFIKAAAGRELISKSQKQTNGLWSLLGLNIV